jgi:type II secretory pathway pseudopilin PulG
MRKKDGSDGYNGGLTLIELMVALAICFIVIGAVYRAFISQQRTYAIQDQVAEAQQNARAAMTILMRDLWMAGHGKPDGDVVISGETYRHTIEVSKGANEEDPDAITVVGCFGSPKGYLTRTANRDDTQIAVRSTGNVLRKIFEKSNHIFIGGMERLTVADAPDSDVGILTLNGPLAKRYPTGVLSGSVESGATQLPLMSTEGLRAGDVLFLGQDRLIVRDVGTDTITIDTDPDLAANQGISASYPAGTYVNPVSVYRLTAVEYSVETDAALNRPNLIRDDLVEGKRTLAENIQGLDVNPDDQNDQALYTIRLTARTRVRDPDHRENDGYRTRILESQVKLRNL